MAVVSGGSFAISDAVVLFKNLPGVWRHLPLIEVLILFFCFGIAYLVLVIFGKIKESKIFVNLRRYKMVESLGIFLLHFFGFILSISFLYDKPADEKLHKYKYWNKYWSLVALVLILLPIIFWFYLSHWLDVASKEPGYNTNSDSIGIPFFGLIFLELVVFIICRAIFFTIQYIRNKKDIQ
jgi:hypothetical protein